MGEHEHVEDYDDNERRSRRRIRDVEDGEEEGDDRTKKENEIPERRHQPALVQFHKVKCKACSESECKPYTTLMRNLQPFSSVEREKGRK
ncbi:hypothetical protein BLOT_003699 [Blomia tropicalis]|nr:hypothetical protein BLOT_003699 [Blomia tropicalis]